MNIGLLIPVLSAVFSDNQENIFSFLRKFINFNEQNQNLIFLIFILSLIVKNMFSIFCNYKQTLFTSSLKLYLNKLLFRSYLDISYPNFKKKSSSLIIRNLVTETDNFIAVIYNYINLILEILLVIGIFIVLLCYDYKITLICFFSLSFLTLIYILTFQKYLKKIGKISLDNTALLLKEINESLDNFKIIKLFRNNNFFVNNFYNKSFLATDSKRKHMFIHSLVRPYIEIVLFSILLILLILFPLNEKLLEDNLTKLSFFSLVFIRLIPSANKIINSLQKIKYSSHSIKTVLNEIKEAKENQLSKNLKKVEERSVLNEKIVNFNFNKDLIIDSIFFNFDEKKIIENLSIKIKTGKIVGIKGPSGIGKSLLADLICGLLKPNKGKILLGDEEIFSDLKEWQANIGYISQNIYLTENSIEKNIYFGSSDHEINNEKLEKLYNICELNNFITNLEHKGKTLIGERSINISGGQKQRIGIARCLYRDPKIIIFDESFSGIDSNTSDKILENLKKNYSDIKIIIISHSDTLLKKLDDKYLMQNGQLIKI